MSRYIVSPEASRDLDEISDYFAATNIEAGEKFVGEFNRKCRNLINFPNMGRSYEELAASVRGLPLMGYIILYRAIDGGIEIIRVVRGERDLPSLFSDEDE
ncbi:MULTISPECIES: type II toxin-antitoxin system RelE/ParE family toxin [unclassified Microcoleus]|uniref:type II toxin-antitoxin system RelE/ParE family toxin n=1 Tax=unclassified Microcoleus TaxID=2642155 RepID=UPI0025F66619|nr:MULTISPECIES: type II toxin-antitoxin system RelE/ParE family toxin [unclassified Microcoleus]